MTLIAATAEKIVPLRDKLGATTPEAVKKWIDILIYGEAGVGKTYLLGTASQHPDTFPLLILDIEGGMETLKGWDNIDVLPIRNLQELNNAHKELFMDKSGYYKTLGIDTMNELLDLDMTEILKARDSRRPDLKGEPPGQREYGISRNHMRATVRAFRDLPMHTFLIAHASTDKDEEVTKFAPMFPGKLQKEIPGFMDIVGFMTSDSKEVDKELVMERRLQFAKTKRVVAKDRTGKFGLMIENPTIPMMWDMYKSGGNIDSE